MWQRSVCVCYQRNARIDSGFVRTDDQSVKNAWKRRPMLAHGMESPELSDSIASHPSDFD